MCIMQTKTGHGARANGRGERQQIRLFAPRSCLRVRVLQIIICRYVPEIRRFSVFSGIDLMAPLPFFSENGMDTPGFPGDGDEGAVLQDVMELPLRPAATASKPAHTANRPKKRRTALIFAVNMPEMSLMCLKSLFPLFPRFPRFFTVCCQTHLRLAVFCIRVHMRIEA